MYRKVKTPSFFLQNSNNYYNGSTLNIFIINKVIIFQARDFSNLLAVYRAIILDFGIKQHNLIDSVTKKGCLELYHLFKYKH